MAGKATVVAALSGTWCRLEIEPLLCRQIGGVLQSMWAVRTDTDLLPRRATVGDVLPYVAAPLGFGVAFTTVGIFRCQGYGAQMLC